jgi:hypothetical protein
MSSVTTSHVRQDKYVPILFRELASLYKRSPAGTLTWYYSELCRETFKEQRVKPKDRELPYFEAKQIKSGEWVCNIRFSNIEHKSRRGFSERTEAEEDAAHKLLAELLWQSLVTDMFNSGDPHLHQILKDALCPTS